MMARETVLILLTFLICVCDCKFTSEQYSSVPPLFLMDDYEQCMLVKEKSLYCSFTYQLQSPNDSQVWHIVKGISSLRKNYRHDLLRHKICVRKTCPSATLMRDEELKDEINKCYDSQYSHLGLKGNITQLRCITATSSYPFDVYDIVFAFVTISYIVFVLLASFLTNFQPDDSKTSTIFSCFSLVRNWYFLTKSNTSPDAIRLSSMQGIRFYTMICVILSHSLVFNFRGPLINPEYVEEITQRPLNILIANGTFIVQSFFVISGWLLTHHFLQLIEKNPTIKVKYFVLAIFNRTIRLLPTLAFMVAFHATWLIHMGNGPLWYDHVADDYENCRTYWWTNILFVSNFVGVKKMCLQQTWYLAADMQLFLVALIIIAVIWKFPQCTKYLFIVCFLIAFTVPAIIAYVRDFDILLRMYPEDMYDTRTVHSDLWAEMYAPPYNNFGGYFVGMSFGYVYHQYKEEKLLKKPIYRIFWWCFITIACFSVVLVGIFMYHENYSYTRLESAIYWACGRTIFSLGVAVAILGFTQNVGSLLKHFCEWRAVEVFGRLSFSAYIVHLAIIRTRAGLQRAPYYASDFLCMCDALGNICMSFMAATLLCLFIEMPVTGLQKILVPQLEKKRNFSA